MSAVKILANQKSLLEMGFSEIDVNAALDKTSNDLDAATSLLLEITANMSIATNKSKSNTNKLGTNTTLKTTISNNSKQDIKEIHNKFMATYKVSKCKEKGNHDKRQCIYWHTKGDRRRNPFEILYLSIECPDYTETIPCHEGDTCLKAHNMLERMFHPELFKISRCQRGPNGGACERGNLCAFAHSDEDHRIPLSHTLKSTMNSTPAATLTLGREMDDTSNSAPNMFEDTIPGKRNNVQFEQWLAPSSTYAEQSVVVKPSTRQRGPQSPDIAAIIAAATTFAYTTTVGGLVAEPSPRMNAPPGLGDQLAFNTTNNAASTTAEMPWRRSRGPAANTNTSELMDVHALDSVDLGEKLLQANSLCAGLRMQVDILTHELNHKSNLVNNQNIEIAELNKKMQEIIAYVDIANQQHHRVKNDCVYITRELHEKLKIIMIGNIGKDAMAMDKLKSELFNLLNILSNTDKSLDLIDNDIRGFHQTNVKQHLHLERSISSTAESESHILTHQSDHNIYNSYTNSNSNNVLNNNSNLVGMISRSNSNNSTSATSNTMVHHNGNYINNSNNSSNGINNGTSYNQDINHLNNGSHNRINMMSNIGGKSNLGPKYLCGLPGCSIEGIFECSGCNQIRYCGELHQGEHWKDHKKNCKI